MRKSMKTWEIHAQSEKENQWEKQMKQEEQRESDINTVLRRNEKDKNCMGDR